MLSGISFSKEADSSSSSGTSQHPAIDKQESTRDLFFILESKNFGNKELGKLKKILARNPDLNSGNKSGYTAIMIALLAKLPKEVIALLLKNRKLDLGIGYGYDTVIDFACETYPDDIRLSLTNASQPRKDIIKLLIQHNYDVKPNPSRPNYCSYVKNIVMSEMLFENVEINNDAAVELLLELGGDVNCVNKNDETLLMVACKHNCNLVMFQVLMCYDPDINYSNKLGSVIDYINPYFPQDIGNESKLMNTCIDRLIGWGAHPSNKEKRPKFCAYIESNKPKILGDELIQACRKNEYQEIERLIRSGANTKYQTTSGETPISSTLYGYYHETHYTIIQYLLANGADPNVSDETGRTPLFILCRCLLSPYNEKIISLLLDNNAIVGVSNDSLLDMICPNYPNDTLDLSNIFRDNNLREKYSNIEKLLVKLRDRGLIIPDKAKRPNWYNYVKNQMVIERVCSADPGCKNFLSKHRKKLYHSSKNLCLHGEDCDATSADHFEHFAHM
jgi:ankyrin repeat protein